MVECTDTCFSAGDSVINSVLKENISMSTFEGLEQIFHDPQRNQPFIDLETK